MALACASAAARAPAWVSRRVRARAFGVSPGLHQTPIVDALWKRREAALAAKTRIAQDIPDTAPRALTPKSPEDSSSSIAYEFSKPENTALVDKYRNPWGFLRVGRLLEDLDALAGTVAFEHCCSPNPHDKPLHIVTASVDRIKYMHRPNLEDDITLSGQVTWVGRSSMEIRMQACSSWTDKPFMESNFTFVGRCPDTGRAAAINPLQVSGKEQEERFELGKQRDEARKKLRQQAKVSKVGSTLDAEGFAAARDLWAEAKPLLSMPALANPRDVFMRETMLQNTLTTMPQHRNTAGRIFGGFLMRRAFELAFTTAYLFGGRRPVFHELDEVTFLSPVSPGDMLRLDSRVLYTSEVMDIHGRATVHVSVVATVMKPEHVRCVTSNTFNFTFGLSENEDGTGRSISGNAIELRRVLPSTLEEAIRIVERYKADLAQHDEDVRSQAAQ